MNIPSPAAVKKQIDQKKAFESYLTPESSPSASSPKAKGSPGATSNSRKKSSGSSTTNGKRPSKKPSPKVTESKSEATDIPSTPEKTPVTTPKAKKAFVRRDHLTSRPFAQNEGLIDLKTSLTRSSTPKSAGNSRAPHTVPRTSTAKQSRSNTSKKENN